MRIIAGKNRGTILYSPKTKSTRPTLDRVKEALFSILLPYIQDANVLDLFSGTGSLGIEAISRGAKFALLNDAQNYSISTILSNVKLTKSEKYVKISNRDYVKCLQKILNSDSKFDIIFIDPPYESNFAFESLKFLSDNKFKILSENGVIVYETDKYIFRKNSQKYEFDNLVYFDEREYGRVLLRFYKWR